MGKPTEGEWGRAVRSDDVFGALLDRRLVFLQGALVGARADTAMAQILHLEALDPALEVTLHINCPSADPRAALAVYDVIQAVHTPVRTVCLGQAAGGSALVLAGGSMGRRAALPNARITFSEGRTALTGTAAQLDLQARELLRVRRQIHERLAAHTGQPLERIERDAGRDLWLSAEEAQAYGLIDEVLPVGTAGQDPERPRS
jgi:ATP-dependent Clp protease protease subunit